MTVAEVVPAEEEAIRLIPPSKDERVNETNPPIEWCVSRRLREELERLGVTDPQLLLTVSNGEEELWRDIVPLFNMLHYVPFYRPGKNTLHAKPLYEKKEEGSPKRILKKKNDGVYAHEVLEHCQPELDRLRALLQGEDDLERRELIEKEMDLHRDDPQECVLRDTSELPRKINFLEGKGELAFDISAEPFAAKPNRLLAWIANFGFETKPKDECQLKRRFWAKMAFSWVLGPILLAVFLVIEAVNLVIAGVLLAFGVRNLSPQSILRPFTFTPTEVWSRAQPSFWFSKKVGTDEDGEPVYEERPELLQMFAPPMVAVMAGIVFLVTLLTGSVSILFGLILAVLILAAICVLILVVSLGSYVAKRLLGDSYTQWSKARKERREAAKQKAREREAKELAEELELLTCNSGENGIPKRRQSVRLRVWGHKSDKCRSFAK